MIDINYILSKLSKVRSQGKNQWRSCCPAHGGEHANMAIRLTNEGHVLFKCHSRGCGVGDIISGAGLTWNDIMPESYNGETIKPKSINMPYGDGLKLLRYESQIVMANAYAMKKGIWNSSDIERLELAMNRINTIYKACGL